MSSVVHPHSEPPSDHDELVAYLDGELAPEECRMVEERLANDAEYRQQLRDLDQAWEALNTLPTTAVDDGFAPTTIELACVAAEEDLSKHKSLANLENRSRTRWWIAGGVVAAVMGFIMVRALTVHRNNMLLADLPVIEQVSALSHTQNLDFLRQLSKTVPAGDFINENNKPVFDQMIDEYSKASAATLEERREWVDSLASEQKAELADRARTFEDLRQKPEEKDRLRRLANEISHESDAATLQQTLIAYGQWLSRQTPGKQDMLREHAQKLSVPEQVAEIEKMVRSENEQAAKHLSVEDSTALRHEIFALAQEKKAELLKTPAGQAGSVVSIDPNDSKMALFLVLREALQNEEYRDKVSERLLSKLSPDAQKHWKQLPIGPRDGRARQLFQWIHEAVQTKPGPEDLENFFVNSLTNDQRQALLDKPHAEMQAELERLYLRSELHIDERWPFLREFGEGGRGPRDRPRGPGPGEGGRRGLGPRRGPDGPPDGRPDGPPPGEEFRPEGPPRERFDGERPPGPGGRPRRPPGDRPPLDGPPPDENPPPI